MSDLTSIPTPQERRPLVPVESAWGGTLYVCSMSAWDMATLPEADNEAFMAGLLLKCVVYADRTPVWKTEEEVLAYPMADIKPFIAPVLKANGITQGAMDEIKGNSPGDPA
jgi:hypothetical protein